MSPRPSSSLPPAYITTPHSVDPSPEDEYIPMSGDRPSGLSMDDFLPVSSQSVPIFHLATNIY